MGEAKRRRQQLGALYGTPEGSNRPPQGPVLAPCDADTLMTAYLSRDDRRDVVLLLRDGPASWERRYQPLPETADLVVKSVTDIRQP